jgi:preprotein translocase subunit SecD
MHAVSRRLGSAALIVAGLAAPVSAEAWQRLDMVFRTAEPAAQGVAEVFAKRLDGVVSEPEISVNGSEVLVSALTATPDQPLAPLLMRSGRIGVHKVTSVVDQCPAETNGQSCLPEDQPNPRFFVLGPEELGNNAIADAQPGFDQNGLPAINLRMTDAAARSFGQLTAASVGELLAMVIEGKVVTAPRIISPILAGQVQITGSFTTASATELAVVLGTPELPAKVDLISTDARPADPPKRSLTDRLFGLFD